MTGPACYCLIFLLMTHLYRAFFFCALILSSLAASGAAEADVRPLAIGALKGPHAEIWQFVRGITAQNGLDFTVLEYPDAAQLNADLRAGKLDANSGQDAPGLAQDNAAHGQALVQAAYTITLPTGIYSKTLRSLRDLAPGSAVAIPRRPEERGRALILLHNYGLINFADNAGLAAGPSDITYNPRELKFEEVAPEDYAQALKAYPIVAIPYQEAGPLGLYPARDALAMDDARSPYAQVLAVRAADREKPWVEQLVKAYHSDPVKRFILTRFQDSVRRPW